MNQYALFVIAFISYTIDACSEKSQLSASLEQKLNTACYHVHAQARSLLLSAQHEDLQALEKISFASDREQETLIYFLNKLSMEPHASSSNSIRKVLKMLACYKSISHHNKATLSYREWLLAQLNKDTFAQGNESLKDEVSLFKQALEDDRDVRDNVAAFARDIQRDSVIQKESILTRLEEETNNAIHAQITFLSQQTENLLETNASEEQIRDLNFSHTARLYSIIKNSKDMMFALQPMCFGLQELCFIVDRQTYSPIINIINPALLPADPFNRDIDYTKLNVLELSDLLQHIKKTLLKKGYVLKVPRHILSQQSFLQKLRAIYWNHHKQDDRLNASSSSLGSDWSIIDMHEIQVIQESAKAVGYGQLAYKYTVECIITAAKNLKWW